MPLPSHDPFRCTTTDGISDPAMSNGNRASLAHCNISAPLHTSDDYADIISNLLHLAHSKGHDPEAILRTATTNFLAESGPLPDQPPIPNVADPRRDRILEIVAASDHVKEGSVEIADHPVISEGDDNGCYVSAWIWCDFTGTDLNKDQPSDECTTCNNGTCPWCRAEQAARFHSA